MARVLRPALDHAQIAADDVDGVFVGTVNNGFQKQDIQGAIPGLIEPALANKPAVRVEDACASGSAAIYAALNFLEAGQGKIALVVGVEKMTTKLAAEVGDILLGASYRKEEAEVEGGFAGIFARITQNYFQRYGDRSEELARIAAKNHKNGVANPYAQMRKELSFEFCNILRCAKAGGKNREASCEPVRGLKSKGHPIGATGVSMHIMASMQLMGEAGSMQIPDAALAGVYNMGGGAVANFCSILERAR